MHKGSLSLYSCIKKWIICKLHFLIPSENIWLLLVETQTTCCVLTDMICVHSHVYWPLTEGQQTCGSPPSAGAWRRSCRGREWASQTGGSSGAYSWRLPPRGCSATPPLTPLTTSSAERRRQEWRKEEGNQLVIIIIGHCRVLSCSIIMLSIYKMSDRVFSGKDSSRMMNVIKGWWLCTFRSENCCWILGRSIRYFSISSFSRSSLETHRTATLTYTDRFRRCQTSKLICFLTTFFLCVFHPSSCPGLRIWHLLLRRLFHKVHWRTGSLHIR